MVAAQAALDLLFKHEVEKVILTRPAVTSGEEIGFLPGDKDAKLAPYTAARKNVNSDYKANRQIKRITNWEMYDDKEQEYASMSAQIERLVEYLHMLPVDLLAIDKVEADDVIAYIGKEFDQSKVTIVSSDKDFMQIVNDRIQIYSPVKKKVYGPVEVLEEQGVLPSNYLIVKSLLGDNSDNLSGVKGLGIKGIIKHFLLTSE